MYRILTNTPTSKRVFAACFLSFATLMAPIPSLGNVTSARAHAVAPNVLPALSLTVNDTSDNPDIAPDGVCEDMNSRCTLRAAIEETNNNPGNDSIGFSLPPNSTITLTSSLPDIEDSLTIAGPGSSNLRVSGNDIVRVFKVNLASPGTVNFSGLTISDGRATMDVGGGIYNDNTATVNVSDSAISNNFAVLGGGLANSSVGKFTLTNSTVSDNSAGTAGGIYNGLGIFNLINSTLNDNSAAGGSGNGGGINLGSGTLNVTNSTFSNNSAAGDGGGIYRNGSGTVNVTNSTLSNNSASGSGGGIAGIGSGPVNIASSIIALNNSSSGPDLFGAMTSQGYNLIGRNDGSTGFTAGISNPNGDLVGTNATPLDPLLGPLANNGGPTRTHRLLTGSQAIDQGKNFATDENNIAILTDQRGRPRPVDLAETNVTGGDGSDIGAYELQSETPQSGTTLIVNTADDHDDGACTDTNCTLREAIILANSDSDETTITFDIPGAGPHLIQLTGLLDELETDMSIEGPTGEVVEVRGEGSYGIFTILDPIVGISNLTISNGGDIVGGGIYNEADLQIDNCKFTGNLAGFGGAIENFGGFVIINNSTFTNNQALFGGAIENDLGSITINNSTFTENEAGFGGAISNTNALNIENTTFNRNHSFEAGGAIDTESGDLIIINSTISGNTSEGDGGGLAQCDCDVGSSVLTNVTVTDNRADSLNTASGVGGGISNFGSNPITLYNTIVAGNFLGQDETATPSDIDGSMEPESSYNLIGVGGSGGLVDLSIDPTHGNQVGVANPGLGPLQDNGGPTLTHALPPGSPALNAAADMTRLDGAIDDTQTSFDVLNASGIPNCLGFVIQIDDEQMLVSCHSGNTVSVTRGFNATTPAAHATGAGVNPAFDQRGSGFPRRVFARVDVGAFEVQPGTPDHLAFSVQPSNTIAGATITPAVQVQLLDFGNSLTTSTADVTLSIGTNPGGGTLSGTTTVAAVNGTATFSNLSIDQIGSGYTLIASSAGLLPATSNPFNILSPASISGSKTVSGAFTQGSTVSYTVVLSNAGPGAQLDNPGDEFTDMLPSGLTLVSANATSGTAATLPANTVTWNGSIASGGSVTITITATINVGTSGQTISNQGTISYDADGNGTNEAPGLTDDPAAGGTSDPTSFNVGSPASVSGTKTKAGGSTQGATVTYTVVLSNAGPAAQLDNPGDEFTDLLPSGLTLVSANATSGTAATLPANTVTWNGSIPSGGWVTITITATINAGTSGQTISNQGTISYDADGNGTNEGSGVTDDPAVGGASDPTSFKVLSPSNVSGTKTKAGGSTPGSTVTYTVVLSSSSSSAQLDNPGNEFVDVLASSLTLVSANATSGIPVATLGTNTVTWNGSIPAGSSVTITITATINNVPNNTIISNQGTINYDADGNGTNEASRSTDDPAVGGASDPTNFAVVVAPDLTITKTHGGNFSGGQVGASYTITVSNLSSGPTSGLVTVTDTVPVGLTPTGPSGVVNGWNCSISGQTVTCTRSDALAGGSSYPPINLTVNVANPAPSNVTNTATVSGGGEANTGNNTTSDPTAVNCNQDFGLNNTNPLMISRFRMNGPAGPQDEYVEIFNPSTTPHTVASGICGGSGGYGVYASAGNGTTSNAATLVCYVPNGTVIPAGGYYLCTGVTYSLNNLGRNGGAAGATATGDAPIGCGGTCGANIPDDAGLVLFNQAVSSISPPPAGGFNALLDPGFIIYDKLGFEPYGAGAPVPTYPSLAATYCEGSSCLKPVGDASTGAACANPTGLFPVFPAPPACYGLAGQYGFVRRQTLFDFNLGTLHQDTNSNGNDFLMVTPNPATDMGVGLTGVFGVSGVLGASGPYNTNAPPDMPAVKLTRTPFDGTNQSGPLNLERRYLPDPTVANPANDPLGTLTLRFKYTNNSGSPINGLRFEVDNLSTLCGPQSPTPATPTVGTGDARNVGSSPNCGTGSFTAILKGLNSAAQIMVDSGGTARSVNGTVLEDLSVGGAPGAGPLSPNGGGIDNTFIINPSSANASVGDGVTGGVGNFATTVGTTDPAKVIRVQVKFGVVRNGRFILLLVPMAKSSPGP